MSYPKEERLLIGKCIHDHEFTLSEAAVEFDISKYTARDYLRYYKAKKAIYNATNPVIDKISDLAADPAKKAEIEALLKCSKEEFIIELLEQRASN